MKTPKIDHDNPSVKLSTCPTCKGSIRVAVTHTMTPKGQMEFSKEVMKYDLNVQNMPLSEYQALNISRCKCP